MSKSICLDPGHGGNDSGAVGPTGLREADVTLAVGLLVAADLQAAGIDVVMTRRTAAVPWSQATTDEDLQARCTIAIKAKTDMFLSIHCNSFTDPTAHGSESYCLAFGGQGQVLAADVLREVVAEIGTTNRGVKAANYEVLRNTIGIPAALIETAFISNPVEEKLLGDPSTQAKLATAITEGICTYFNVRFTEVCHRLDCPNRI
jgi:N-acetylmuramoyl-L-alanine amidase